MFSGSSIIVNDALVAIDETVKLLSFYASMMVHAIIVTAITFSRPCVQCFKPAPHDVADAGKR